MVPHYRNYRVYLLDVSDHFLAAKDVVCETDQEAFAKPIIDPNRVLREDCGC